MNTSTQTQTTTNNLPAQPCRLPRGENNQPITFDRAIDEQQATDWSADRYARHRRYVLTMLNRTSDELIEGFGEDLEILEASLDMISEYLRFLETMKGITESAQARLMVVVDHLLGDELEDKEPAAQ